MIRRIKHKVKGSLGRFWLVLLNLPDTAVVWFVAAEAVEEVLKGIVIAVSPGIGIGIANSKTIKRYWYRYHRLMRLMLVPKVYQSWIMSL